MLAGDAHSLPERESPVLRELPQPGYRSLRSVADLRTLSCRHGRAALTISHSSAGEERRRLRARQRDLGNGRYPENQPAEERPSFAKWRDIAFVRVGAANGS